MISSLVLDLLLPFKAFNHLALVSPKDSTMIFAVFNLMVENLPFLLNPKSHQEVFLHQYSGKELLDYQGVDVDPWVYGYPCLPTPLQTPPKTVHI